MEKKKSRVLIIGATGNLGHHLANASLHFSHPTFALVRPDTFSDPRKSQNLQALSDAGVTLLQGSLEDEESLVEAVKQVDVVVCAVQAKQVLHQKLLIQVIKNAGSIKRFVPSEFGLDPDKTQISEMDYNFYSNKAEIRRLVEAQGIPYTFVSSNFYTSYLLPSLVQPGLKVPPRDKVTIFGDGNTKGVFVKEIDVAAFTIRTLDDPRTLNKVLYFRPPGNVYSLNELVELWESKIGKKLEKVFVSEEELLKKIKETSYPDNMALIFIYSAFIKGDQTYFDIESADSANATKLYPELNYTTISQYLDTLFIETNSVYGCVHGVFDLSKLFSLLSLYLGSTIYSQGLLAWNCLSPNQVALDYMREKIGNWNQLVLGGGFLHLRCCCHILNLIVRDGMEELDSSIDGIRNSVKYIRSSPARLEKFRKCAAQEKIEHKGGIVPLDVCTRWNSTYFMLDLACKYKKAFLRLEDEDQQFENYFQKRVGGSKRQGPPRVADWEKVARLVKFLKIFYDATLKFSATKHVTANEPLLWMCTIVGELDKCIASEDPLLVSIGTSMKKKFDKYWLQLEDFNKILLIAVVLDPRYKLLYLEFFFPKLQADQGCVQVMIDDVKTTLSSLFDFYADEDPAAAAASRNVTMPRIESTHQQADEDSHAANLHQFKLLRQEKDVVVIKNELDKYLLDASEDPSNPKFEILAWWKENAPRYPILSQIAKDVFAVPASTVASESAFSLGKRVVDPFRASLTPKMVEGLVCLSDWLRGAGFDAYKEPSKDELQLYEELEKLEIDGGASVVSDSEE